MRTTLNIDDDVRRAAREIAAARNMTAGTAISELVREALTDHDGSDSLRYRNGFPQFSSIGRLITNEMIEAMMDNDN
jgi:hypothetical protein